MKSANGQSRCAEESEEIHPSPETLDCTSGNERGEGVKRNEKNRPNWAILEEIRGVNNKWFRGREPEGASCKRVDFLQVSKVSKT